MSALAALSLIGAANAQITDWQKPDPFRGEEVDPAAREKALEDEFVVPRLPERTDWQEFHLNASTRNRYFIARDPLYVGKDGAVRYVVRVVAPSGTENISAEGLRCGNAERRIYATLRPDREWSASRASRWLPIGDGNRLNSYALAFYAGYMCSDGFALQPKQILQALADSFNARTGNPLTGFR
ncbi:CNP1-like family protein [Methyloversatilis sp.]|uniref:CNP1-like family protein n=1 Tax=Methyloversatilis sp. TaxID=2569862 RepID=UPI0035B0F942